jgi:hypothetical protein
LTSKYIKFPAFGNITLPVALYGYEAWSVTTLKEEHRLRALVSGLLRKIFVPSGEKVTGVAS